MSKNAFFKLSPAKRKRIIDAAKEEFLEYKDNYDKASVKRIAEKADIAIGSIYKYFEDKNDLFFEVFHNEKQAGSKVANAESLFAYSREELKAGMITTEDMKNLLDILYDNSSLMHSLVFDTRSPDYYGERVRAHLKKDRENGLLKDDIDDELAAYLYETLEYTTFQYCRSHGLDYTLDFETLPKLENMLFFGIYKDDMNKK